MTSLNQNLPNSCMYSFEDLLRESGQDLRTDVLYNLSQDDINAVVKILCDDIHWGYDDRLGTDGLVYTAFYKKKDLPKVLIVDDTPLIRSMMIFSIKNLEVSHDVACDGFEAIEKCKINHYDLIFMDGEMPGMYGMEATKKLREMGFKTPIIANTGNIEHKELFLEAGVTAFYTKGELKPRCCIKYYIYGKQK